MNGFEQRATSQLALRESMRIRQSFDLNPDQATPIWTLISQHGLSIRHLELDVEGIYIRGNPSTILICANRPLGRRTFTVAHEFGHHIFGHGTTIDELVTLRGQKSEPRDEFLANTFAGFLLMAPLAVRRSFLNRSWNPRLASPREIYTVACSLGVGYSTLIDHMTYALKIIERSRRRELIRVSPKNIRREVLGKHTAERLIIVDRYWNLPTIDVETGQLVLLPKGFYTSGDILDSVDRVNGDILLRAIRPGIATVSDGSWSLFIRASRPNYIGLDKYRHLEDQEFPSFQEVPLVGC